MTEAQHGALIGRADEVDVVRAATVDGGGIVVFGRPGVGKSRLLNEVVGGHSGPVVRIAGTPTSVPVAFGAFASLWPTGDEALSPGGLFGALAARVCGEGHRVLLVVEDAHAIDDDSAALVQHLAAARDVVVLMASRPQAGVPEAISALWSTGVLSRLDLQPLARSDADELVQEVVGGTVGRAARDAVWNVAGGNPLFTREVVLDAEAAGHLRMSRGVWVWDGQLGAAQRLSDVVGARISRLSDTAVHALRLVAFGAPLPVTAFTAAASGAAVEELDSQQLLELRGDEVEVSHPLYAEVVRAATPPVRRRTVMAELAALLTANGVRGRSERLRVALFAAESGFAIDDSLMVAAAKDALALGQLEHAEKLARAAGAPDTSYGLVLAAVLFMTGKRSEADEVLAAVRMADLDDEQIVEWARWRARTIGEAPIDLGAAAAVIESAARAVADPVWQAFLTVQYAAALAVHGRIDEGYGLAASLIDHEQPAVRLRALSPWGAGAIVTGRPAEAARRALASMEDALALRELLPEAPYWAATIAVSGYGLSGDVPAMVAVLDATEGSWTPYGHGGLQLALRGYGERLRGRTSAAETMLREAAHELEHKALDYQLRWTLAQIAIAAALHGDVVAAEAAWTEADQGFGPWGTSNFDFHAELAAIWVKVAQGDLASALSTALRLADQHAARGWLLAEMLALHEACRLGATELAERLATVAGRVDGPWALACGAQAMGVQLDDPVKLADAAEQFAALDATVHAAEAYRQAAASYGRHGLTANEASSNARAVALLDRCDVSDTYLLQEVPATPLTRREREVASLAAAGLSSKQIAAQLFISQRTVDTHLGRAYTKLGVSRREDLPPLL
jgi:DNA-binding CsgD family transcriptional regulator